MADMKIGGDVFTDVYYLDRDKANAAFRKVAKGNDSYTVTAIQLPDITRIYARWTNEDQLGMYIELGLGQELDGLEESQSNGVYLRHAYGWWDMGPHFRFLAGHTTTPFSPLNPSQLLGSRSGSLNSVGVGYGDFYSGRIPQVRGTFYFSKYARLAIALVDPHGVADEVGKDAWRNDSPSENTKIPRVDVGLRMRIGPVLIYPSFLYQHRSVDIRDNTTGVPTKLDTYVGSLGFNLGAGNLTLRGEGNWGKNWGDTRGLIGNSPPAMLASAVIDPSGKIHDAKTYSFWLDLCYRLGPVTPHLIYGEMNTKSLDPDSYLECEVKSTMWGLSIPIDLAKGLRLRPEFMWYDDGKLHRQPKGSLNYGKYAIYGVQFQISF
jgi:hypothetical protein